MKKFRNVVSVIVAILVLTAQMPAFAQAPTKNVIDGIPYTFNTYYDDLDGLYSFQGTVIFTPGIKNQVSAPAGYEWQSVGMIVNYGEIGLCHGWYGFSWYAADNSPNEENWIDYYYDYNEETGDMLSKAAFGIQYNGKYYDACQHIVSKTMDVVEVGEEEFAAMEYYNLELLLPAGYKDATFSFRSLYFDPAAEGFLPDLSSVYVTNYR